eukprot:scaffold7728_cov123-Chaetoceros_neogracile.AAC.1
MELTKARITVPHSDHPMAVDLVMMMEAPKARPMALHWDRPMATNLDRPMVRLMALRKDRITVPNWAHPMTARL